MTRDLILNGDVYACLNQLENNSISVAITSPPYWKQRDYGYEEQIGQEKTPEEYIGRLVAVYNKLRDKLTEDGLFFLNVGDKYLNRYGKSHLLQIPYRLAYNMVKDGWILLDIIMWYKPNHMPSSVKDRLANTFEPILVFAKNQNNIYKNKGSVVKIPLQPTPWKHTATYPERLVEEMLMRTELKNGNLVLDPFAGTGTTAVVVKNIRNNLTPIKINSVMIEKGEEFLKIIKQRTGIKKIEKIDHIDYKWKAVTESSLNNNINPLLINNDNRGEVVIFEDSEKFQSALKGLNEDSFKSYHRDDALYFFGVKKWNLDDLYFIHKIFDSGYVLRNMIVSSDGYNWYPIFMFASNSTRVAYKFYLDRVRIKPKTAEKREWSKESFIDTKVRDISGKKSKEGRIIDVLSYYDDKFPKIVAVQWNGYGSIEFVLHPEEDEFLMESLSFLCPKCNRPLEDPYDPMAENKCRNCGTLLFTEKSNLPIMKEPENLANSIKELECGDYIVGQVIDFEEYEESKKQTSSKFADLDRINWGASPGARKVMLGEYFTKMRLYRIDQATIAQYLTIFRESENLKISEIVDNLPKGYHHTVGHWFRKDFGGSIPIPADVEKIRFLLKIETPVLKVMERTALKFQTVKSSIKGRNPGDFIETDDCESLETILKLLYLPPNEYLRVIESYGDLEWKKPK